MPSKPLTEEEKIGSGDPAVRLYRPPAAPPSGKVPEIGGRKDGTEPTRFGDWEKDGRCIDF